jgi:mRNA-degrading endonuclease RelE of RelBE toxin-antitoxin system
MWVMFRIEFTPEALGDIRQLRPYEQRQIIDRIQTQLLHQPAQVTRNRKRLRPNRLAEWELRIDTFRVFYDIDAEYAVVKIEAIGYKHGNRLYIHGEEYEI